MAFNMSLGLSVLSENCHILSHLNIFLSMPWAVQGSFTHSKQFLSTEQSLTNYISK
jgi:hypothetical protein